MFSTRLLYMSDKANIYTAKERHGLLRFKKELFHSEPHLYTFLDYKLS